MPIRLNLLSEAQALEESRRKDPVKRVALVAAVITGAMLVWSSSLQVCALVSQSEVSRLESVLASQTNAYSVAVEQQRRLTEVKHKFAALQQLATNRFLQAPVLNALKQTVVDDVALTRLRTEQNYVYLEASQPTTNGSKKIVPGKPASVKERIVITLDAKDTAAQPGREQMSKYKQSVAECGFFKDLLGKTNEVRLASLSAPIANVGARPYVTFSLECKLPEKVR